MVLPVELTEFAASPKANTNHITWRTETELNSQYHIVERSSNGIDNWTEIGRKLAAGTTQVKQHYELEDERPLPMSYYRLKMVDFDGKFEYSKVVNVERKSDGFSVVNVFPTPADTKVTLKVNVPEASNLTVSVSDINGRVLQIKDMEISKGQNDLVVDVANFAAGTYFVKIDNGIEILTERIIKQ
ncbi:MAG: T9SS type A sorting domain-containing protein [Saprospiraceae bacterium]|nr:T9SS type A sorting domain-containing protein [Saprospiraceae bacterium]